MHYALFMCRELEHCKGDLVSLTRGDRGELWVFNCSRRIAWKFGGLQPQIPATRGKPQTLKAPMTPAINSTNPKEILSL